VQYPDEIIGASTYFMSVPDGSFGAVVLGWLQAIV